MVSGHQHLRCCDHIHRARCPEFLQGKQQEWTGVALLLRETRWQQLFGHRSLQRPQRTQLEACHSLDVVSEWTNSNEREAMSGERMGTRGAERGGKQLSDAARSSKLPRLFDTTAATPLNLYAPACNPTQEST